MATKIIMLSLATTVLFSGCVALDDGYYGNGYSGGYSYPTTYYNSYSGYYNGNYSNVYHNYIWETDRVIYKNDLCTRQIS